MKIYLGCDHAGFNMRLEVMNYLKELGYETEECLFHEYNKEDDYTDAAEEVIKKVSEEDGGSAGFESREERGAEVFGSWSDGAALS